LPTDVLHLSLFSSEGAKPSYVDTMSPTQRVAKIRQDPMPWR